MTKANMKKVAIICIIYIVIVIFAKLVRVQGFYQYHVPRINPDDIYFGTPKMNWIPFGKYSSGWLLKDKIILNMLLFVPAGIFSKILIKNKPLSIIAIALFCFSFEFFQHVFKTGYFDITTVIFEIVGALIGVGIFACFKKKFSKRV